MSAPFPAALTIDCLTCGYGHHKVLDKVSMAVGQQEVVALLGRNGVGKSTALKAAFGVLPVWSGCVMAFGKAIHPITPRTMIEHGVAYLPQGARVFASLSVKENLTFAGTILANPNKVRRRIEIALESFPLLAKHLDQSAGSLSGGEKQMLAISNLLMLSPKMVLLDEPTVGLSPRLAEDTFQSVLQLSRSLKMGVLIVEQKIRQVLNISDRVYILNKDSTIRSLLAGELRSEEAIFDVMFGNSDE